MAKMSAQNPWLLLMHQLPPKPESLRVRVWRSLQRLGALSIKNSVYALPNGAYAQRELAKLAREIHAGGGEAVVCAAEFIKGINSAALSERYNQELDKGFKELGAEISGIAGRIRKLGAKADFMEIEHQLGRARSLLQEMAEKNAFGSGGEADCRALLEKTDQLLRSTAKLPARKIGAKARYYQRTWVTRVDVRTDRMASAWLIRRHIDRGAKFAFVSPKEKPRAADEIRFDMFGAEFTHEGELCTFEVLLERFQLRSPSLQRLGQIIHDLDIRDEKYGRPETAGVELFLNGLAKRVARDEARLKEAFSFFDSLEASFSQGEEAKES